MLEVRLKSGSHRRLALVAATLAFLGTAGAQAGTGGAEAGQAPDGQPRILATGDSMMRYTDGRLKSDLLRTQDVAFFSDIRIGTGISKTQDNWTRNAGRQARKYLPTATVVFLGAAEGFHMPGARCCGTRWIYAYAKRVKKMIRAYARNGAHVYWLTLPAARDTRRHRIFRSVNRGIRRAVRTSGPRAHLVNVAAVLTPRGRYRRTMHWQGQQVIVRTEDGVHLTSGGHAVVTPLIIAAMRRDGVIF